MLYAIERGYSCQVCRMHVEEATPKNHILYGWPAERPPPPEVVRALSQERCDSNVIVTGNQRDSNEIVACAPAEVRPPPVTRIHVYTPLPTP